MSKSWTIDGKSVDQVKASMEENLQQSSLPSAFQANWSGNALQVSIDKAGKSEFELSVLEEGGKTVVKETKRKVSMMHKPFVGKVESFIEDLMGKLG